MIPLLTGILLGVATIWVPRGVIDPVARAVIPAIALLATGIFPCMTLAVNAMKGDNRAPRQVDELYDQLATVMRVLVASFTLAALAIALIAALVGMVSIEGPTDASRWTERSVLFCACVTVGLLAGRVVAVGRAFFAILDINRKHALLVARAKVQGARDTTSQAWQRDRFAPDRLSEAVDLERA